MGIKDKLLVVISRLRTPHNILGNLTLAKSVYLYPSSRTQSRRYQASGYSEHVLLCQRLNGWLRQNLGLHQVRRQKCSQSFEANVHQVGDYWFNDFVCILLMPNRFIQNGKRNHVVDNDPIGRFFSKCLEQRNDPRYAVFNYILYETIGVLIRTFLIYFRIETGSCSTRSTLTHHKQLDLNQEGSVVDLQSLDYGTFQICRQMSFKIFSKNSFLFFLFYF